MSITEAERHHLYQRLEAVLGADEAAILMEHLPPVGWADVATKRDLDHLETVLRGDMSVLETRLGAVETRLGGRTTELDIHLSSQISELDIRLSSRITELDIRLGALDSSIGDRIATSEAVLRSEISAVAAGFSRQLQRQTYSLVGSLTAVIGVAAVVLRLG